MDKCPGGAGGTNGGGNELGCDRRHRDAQADEFADLSKTNLIFKTPAGEQAFTIKSLGTYTAISGDSVTVFDDNDKKFTTFRPEATATGVTVIKIQEFDGMTGLEVTGVVGPGAAVESGPQPEPPTAPANSVLR